MAYAAAAVAVIGIVGGTIQKYQEIEAKEAALEAQAKALGRQADAERQAAEFEATAIREAAAFQERQSRRRIGILVGKQLATTAAGGVSLTSGSAQFAELDAIREGEIEALGIRRAGSTAAEARLFAGRIREAELRFAGQMAKFGARIVRRQKVWTILSGVTSLVGLGAGGGAFGAQAGTTSGAGQGLAI